jgi:hypothetical protein
MCIQQTCGLFRQHSGSLQDSESLSHSTRRARQCRSLPSALTAEYSPSGALASYSFAYSSHSYSSAPWTPCNNNRHEVVSPILNMASLDVHPSSSLQDQTNPLGVSFLAAAGGPAVCPWTFTTLNARAYPTSQMVIARFTSFDSIQILISTSNQFPRPGPKYVLRGCRTAGGVRLVKAGAPARGSHLALDTSQSGTSQPYPSSLLLFSINVRSG